MNDLCCRVTRETITTFRDTTSKITSSLNYKCVYRGERNFFLEMMIDLESLNRLYYLKEFMEPCFSTWRVPLGQNTNQEWPPPPPSFVTSNILLLYKLDGQVIFQEWETHCTRYIIYKTSHNRFACEEKGRRIPSCSLSLRQTSKKTIIVMITREKDFSIGIIGFTIDSDDSVLRKHRSSFLLQQFWIVFDCKIEMSLTKVIPFFSIALVWEQIVQQPFPLLSVFLLLSFWVKMKWKSPTISNSLTTITSSSDKWLLDVLSVQRYCWNKVLEKKEKQNT